MNKKYKTIVNSDDMGITLHLFRDLVQDLKGDYYIAELENAQFGKKAYYPVTEQEAEKIISIANTSIRKAYYFMEELKNDVILDRMYQKEQDVMHRKGWI